MSTEQAMSGVNGVEGQPATGSVPAQDTAGPVEGTCGTSDCCSPAAEGAAAATAAVATESEPRARVQLNPTVSPDQARPIPSLGVTSVPPAEEPAPTPEEAAAGETGVARSATQVPSREQVDIPAKGALEANLEAEINAALSGTTVESAGKSAAAAEDDSDPAPGKKRKGTVLSVHGDNIIVDIGARASGILTARLFEDGKLPEVGAVLDVVVDKYDGGEGLYQLSLVKVTVTRPAGNWDAVQADSIVDCVVTKANKGGLEVNVSNLRGFLPASQVEFGFVSNLEQYVGQKLRVKVLEVNPQKKNLVVSRRAFLEMERAEKRDEQWKTLDVGQKHKGTVKTVKDYGAFIDIGGVDGLLHVGEISWSRINHPKDVLQEGQQVEVVILAIDREKNKVSLGMRQLMGNPWLSIAEKYHPGNVVPCKVTKNTDFGAFVELEPGVEGMVHISELDHRRVFRVGDFLPVGKEVNLQVLNVDVDKKRIALSLKALTPKPESSHKEKRSDEELSPHAGAPVYQRKHKGPLKGGGTGSGGKLFG